MTCAGKKYEWLTELYFHRPELQEPARNTGNDWVSQRHSAFGIRHSIVSLHHWQVAHHANMSDDDEDQVDWEFDDPPMSAEDRAGIRRLTSDEANAFWNAFVSPVGDHLKLLPDESWPRLLVTWKFLRYEWEADWNANRLELMRSLLRDLRDDAGVVYVCESRNWCVETTNGVLARNWINFLYDDEGVLVLSKVDARRCVFSHGRFYSAG
jgi:Protein of unknown function (DUF2947)